MCNHEEADTKMPFHVEHLAAPKNVVVRTVDTDVLIIALANLEKLPAGINVWLEMGHYTNNTPRYVYVNKLHQALGNSLCVALPGLQTFTGSDYTVSFYCKWKIWSQKLLERGEDVKEVFSALKGPLLSEGEIQTTFKTIKKFTCAKYDRQKFTCDGIVLEIYLDHKFQWPQEGLNCESFA